MKKIFFGISAIFVFCLLSCKGITFPNSVAVKTEANYKFDILKIDQNFNEYLSAEKLFPEEENDSIKVYNYNPDGTSDKTQLLISAPIQEIPLDFSEYLDSINLNDSLSKMSIDKSFVVPNVDFTDKKDLELNKIRELINNLIFFTGNSNDTSITFSSKNPTENTFDSIEYSYGGIGISCTGQTPDSTVTITSKDGKTISGTFDSEGIAILTFKDDFVFSKTGMKISFSGQTGLDFGGTISDESKIKKVTGLTLSDSIETSLDKQFEIKSMETLRSCIIEKGTLTTNVEFGSGWTGHSLVFEDVNISGGLNISNISNGTTDLKDKEFKPENLNIAGKIKISFSNANLDFEIIPEVVVDCKIDSLKSATVSLEEDYKSEFSENKKLPEEMTKLIKEIIWLKSGVKISNESNLPSENDIKLSNIKSAFFKINESDKILKTGETFEFYCSEEMKTSISTDSAVDFSVSLSLPDYDEDKKTVTVKNIKPDTEYKIAITIEPTFDWLKISISPNASETSTQSDKISTGFSMVSLFDELDKKLKLDEENSFKKNVDIKSIPTYLFCNFPSVLGDSAKFEGKIKAFIGDSNANSLTSDGEIYILGDKTTNGFMNSSTEPKFVFNESKEVTNNLKSIRETVDFAKLINTSKNYADSSICLEYDLSLSSNSDNLFIGNPNHKDKLSGEKVLDLSENNTISITAMMIVPLELQLAKSMNIDFMNFIKSESETGNSDLFSRTKPSDLSKIEKYLDVIKTMSVNYTPTKLPFGSDNSIKLSIEIPNIEYKKDLSLSEGTLEVNPKEILETYPFEPKISAIIPQGDFWIPKDISLATHIILGIETDGVLKIE